MDYSSRRVQHILGLILGLGIAAVVPTNACAPVAQCASSDLSCDLFASLLYLPVVKPDCLIDSQLDTGWYFFSGSAGEDEIADAVCGLPNGTIAMVGQAADADLFVQGQAPQTAFGGAIFDSNLTLFLTRPDGTLIRWTNFGGPGAAHGLPFMTPGPDGGFYVAAVANTAAVASYNGLTPLVSYHGGISDIIVLRFDAQLNLLWYRYLGSAGGELPRGLAPTGDGGLIILGRTDVDHNADGLTALSPFAGGTEGVLYRLNSRGGLEWFRFLGSVSNDSPFDLKRIPTQPVLVGQSGVYDQFIAGVTFAADLPLYAGLTPTRAFAGPSDPGLVRFDVDGNIYQYSFFGTAANENGAKLLVTRDAEIYLAAGSLADVPLFDGLAPLTPFTAGADIWLLRLNSQMALRSHRFIGSTVSDSVGDLVETPGGEILIGANLGATTALGTPVIANAGVLDIAFLRIDRNDQIQAFSYYGSAVSETVQAMAPTADGGAILGGESSGPGFTLPAGTPQLDTHTTTSGDQFYMRVRSDARTVP